MKKFFFLPLVLCFLDIACFAQGDFSLAPVMDVTGEELAARFRSPDGEAGMSCYWWWLNTAVTKESITNDLEEMKAKGYGSASLIDAGGFNEVTMKPEHGPLFLSPEWIELFQHAVREADRLGISLTVNVSSGWNPGGPYVTPENALKRLSYSEVNVTGGKEVRVKLPQPPTWYMFKDICVQAVKAAPEGAPLRDEAIPYWSAKAFYSVLGFQEIFPLEKLQEGFYYDSGSPVIRQDEIIDLTACFDGDTLVWDAPEGEWTIIRYAYTCNGARTSTTSDGWDGLSIDHLSPEAFDVFKENVLLPLINAAEEAGNSVNCLLTDSWEMGIVNWTARFPEEFRKFRGYDIWKYLPVMTGRVVESPEISNRFLQDLRRTVSDCIWNYHYKLFKEVANEHGMMIDPEAGGPCYTPVDALEMLGKCDIPHGEYWARSITHVASEGARLSVRQSACAAHTNGKRFVEAEGPTSIGPHWERSPRDLKGVIDRAFCSGVNRLVWHTFTASPEEYGTPGVEYFAGTHLNPNVTWWDQAGDFVGYIDRCSYLLQQGLFVADVLYYNGDDVPNMVFLKEEVDDLDFGYDWDKCSKDVILDRLSFSDGKIMLPDGMSYKVLVLPPHAQIDLDVMRKIESLVEKGMVLVGDPPVRTTGLSNYPEGDRELREIVQRLWLGGWVDGVNRTENIYGKGRVIRGQDINNVLASMSVLPDFSYESNDGNTVLDYIHRATDTHDIYFITNRFAYKGVDDYFYRYTPYRIPDRYAEVECRFRVSGKVPELWNPHTGEITPVLNWREEGGFTYIPLNLAPEGSVFVVFSGQSTVQDHIIAVEKQSSDVFPVSSGTGRYPSAGFGMADDGSVYADIYEPGTYKAYWKSGRVSSFSSENYCEVVSLDGDWTVAFDPEWGPADPVVFDSLKSWTEFKDPQIKYFSGTATYTKNFSFDRKQIKGKKIVLDLGNVQDLAVVRINGHEFPVSWYAPYSVDITEYVRPGSNELSVDVVNLWPNRLIGDGKLDDSERKTRSNIKKYDAPDAERYLRVSGLLGPVSISMYDRVEL